MKTPTLSLCMIAKNEAHNLKPLYDSIKGCFDEIILVDTGSTDETVETAKSLGMKVFHFKWIDDFAAARNYSFEQATCDYVMWLDLDDRLMSRELFLLYKRTVLPLHDVIYARYDYAFNDQGECVASFVRERIVRRSLEIKWRDFIHEGLVTADAKGNKILGALATTWHVKHARTKEEADGDRGRNIRLLEAKKDELSPRLKFYYGKELFDAGQHKNDNELIKKAAEVLKEAVKLNHEDHDRLLSVQYLCWSLFRLEQFDDAIKYALIGLQLKPCRAELLCVIADSYAVRGMLQQSIPYYQAAVDCPNENASGYTAEFSSHDCYGPFPRRQLAKVFFQMGEFEKAQAVIKDMFDTDTQMIRFECEKAIQAMEPGTGQKSVDDIVITGHPVGAYLWDGDEYRTRGLGGSETAAVELAEHLHRLTGREVIVFNSRSEEKTVNGVSYRPHRALYGYFQKFRPALHVMWRHPVKFTDAKSVLWCHDLITPGAENTKNYDEILCLSEFHKNYVMSMQSIPQEKIRITRNGLDPARFKNLLTIKQYGKVIWPNSPDRGLEHAIHIMDIVRRFVPKAELHCFYGFENLEKYGLAEKAKELREMIAERPWVKYHGNVDQKTLAEEMATSQVWLYPASFIETFCISAIEALSAKAYPVVRDIGALPHTLKEASEKDQATVLDLPVGPDTYPVWADHVLSAILESKWQRIDMDPDKYSWESVAKEWVKTYRL